MQVVFLLACNLAAPLCGQSSPCSVHQPDDSEYKNIKMQEFEITWEGHLFIGNIQ